MNVVGQGSLAGALVAFLAGAAVAQESKSAPLAKQLVAALEAGKRVMFDSDWKKQKISEEEYMKTFADADERYAAMLTALLAQTRR